MAFLRRLLIAIALLPLFFSGYASADLYTRGSFGVGASGAANYSIPIAVPPGTAGIVPSLSLVYSSQSGVGKLGKSWGLAGLSSITRCGRTAAQDGGGPGGVNFDGNDRFCLDGQRLVLVSGTAYGASAAEYRTEQEGFSKIISYGKAGDGPAYFKVWTKQGNIVEFGITPDSRIELPGSSSVNTWAINKVSDSLSNYISISYTRETGEYYVARVDYVGNSLNGTVGNNAVVFEYEVRPDPLVNYVSGSLIKTNYRMNGIKTLAGNKTVFDYRLKYASSKSASRLESVTQCDISGVCLPPTTFEWQNPGAIGLKQTNWQETGKAASQSAPVESPIILVDINNDGKMDFLQRFDRLGQQGWLLPMISTGDGFIAGDSFRVGGSIFVGDFNGDGKQDLFASLWLPGDTLRYSIYLGNGTGFEPSPTIDTAVKNVASFNVLDINGDGRDDIMLSILGATPSTYTQVSLLPMISNGATFDIGQAVQLDEADAKLLGSPIAQFFAADLNGDGKADMIEVWRRLNADGNVWLRPLISDGLKLIVGEWVDTGAQSYDSTRDYNAVNNFLAMDANGDGLTDMVFSSRLSYVNEVAVTPYYFTGKSFQRGTSTRLDEGIVLPPSEQGLYAADLVPTDLNGDGRVDLVQIWSPGARDNGTWQMKGEILMQPILATSTGFSPQDIVKMGDDYYTIKYNDFDSSGEIYLADGGPGIVFSDFNGDGKVDVLQQKYTNSIGSYAFLPYYSTGKIGDLISGIKNGIGKSVSIEYRPLTDNSTYIKFPDPAPVNYPLNSVQTSIYVVSSTHEGDGILPPTTIVYKYGGYKKDHLRKKSLGFKFSESNNISSGILIKNIYRQDWPFVGFLEKSEKWASNKSGDALLEEVTNYYDCTDFLNANGCSDGAGKRYFSFLKKNIVNSKDLNGASLPTVETNISYENWDSSKSRWIDFSSIYGNVAEVVVSSSDGYVKKTSNVYKNDPNKWFIGKLIRITETNITP